MKKLNKSLDTTTKYPFLYREHLKGLYRTDAFFLFAKQVVEMPLYILEATIMFSLIYWIANLNQEAERFFVALGIIILVLQVVFSLIHFLGVGDKRLFATRDILVERKITSVCLLTRRPSG